MSGERPIVITGATSNLGVVLVERLRSTWPRREILALTRSGRSSLFQRFEIQPVECDLSNPATYESALPQGCEVIAVAHRSYTDKMLPVMSEMRAHSCYAVTSTSVFVQNHPDVTEFRKIEERMRSSQVPVTIMRPSMLYGRGKDQNISRLIGVLSKSPIFPVFGSGDHLMQPVHVDDVADAIHAAVVREARGEYNLGGPSAITYNELLQTVADALNRKILFLHIPQGLAETAVGALQRLPGFPIQVDQVRRLTEDKSYNISAARQELSYDPRTFHEGIRQEILNRRDADTEVSEA